MYGTLTFLPPSNFAVFDDWYFLQYCLQRAGKHKLLILISSFNFCILVYIYGHGFYGLSCMLMRKNVNNDVSKLSPIRRLKRFPSSCELLMICFENSSPCFYLLGICPTVYSRKPQVITRHVLPLLWNLLTLSSNGSAGGNNTSIRASVGKLTTTLYSIMGRLFIEQASTQ